MEGELSGRSERSTRLRGASQWQQRNMAVEDLRKSMVEENIEGGSRDILRAPTNFRGRYSNPSRRGPPKKYGNGQMQH